MRNNRLETHNLFIHTHNSFENIGHLSILTAEHRMEYSNVSAEDVIRLNGIFVGNNW